MNRSINAYMARHSHQYCEDSCTHGQTVHVVIEILDSEDEGQVVWRRSQTVLLQRHRAEGTKRKREQKTPRSSRISDRNPKRLANSKNGNLQKVMRMDEKSSVEQCAATVHLIYGF